MADEWVPGMPADGSTGVWLVETPDGQFRAEWENSMLLTAWTFGVYDVDPVDVIRHKKVHEGSDY
ncbi:MAG: hypothetical protein AAF570_21695 [Bacteroidota bacterium]